MKFRLILLAALFLSINGIGKAQQKQWRLEECVDYALENNIQIKQSELQAKISKNSNSQAQWNYLPSVSSGANYGLNSGLNIDPVTNQISTINRQTIFASVNANWVVYDGGRKINGIAQNNLNYLASMYDLERAKNDIRLNVASAFLQILLNKEILEVAFQQENITVLQTNRMQKLVDAGSNPKGDLLQLESQLARDKQNTVAAENALTISKLQLGNLLQLEDPSGFDIIDPEFKDPEPSTLLRKPENIFTTALENQPVVKSAEMRVKSSEEGVDLSRSSYLPTVSLSGGISSSYSDQFLNFVPDGNSINPAIGTVQGSGDVVISSFSQATGEFESVSFGDQFGDNVNKSFGIGVSVPIFNNSQRYNVKNAKLNLELAKTNLDQEKNTLKQTVYQVHADARAAYNSYLAASKAVDASRESFKYADERYKVGALNQFDFENTKNSLASALSQQVRAKYDFIFKIKVLEFYLTNAIKL